MIYFPIKTHEENTVRLFFHHPLSFPLHYPFSPSTTPTEDDVAIASTREIEDAGDAGVEPSMAGQEVDVNEPEYSSYGDHNDVRRHFSACACRLCHLLGCAVQSS